jgi:uncharacterized membrane protein
VLAIVQDSAALAVIGAGGGFLAPVLASSGEGSHVSALQLLPRAQPRHRGHRVVQGVALAQHDRLRLHLPHRVGVGRATGTRRALRSVRFFLVAFFLLFVAIAVMVGARGAPARRALRRHDAVFGVPLAAFGLQSGDHESARYGLAFSALAAAAMYLGARVAPAGNRPR